MPDFRPSKTPVRWYARFPAAVFGAVDPEDFSRFCQVVSNDVDVSLSRAGRDCVTRMPIDLQDRYIVAALPFAEANWQSRRRGGPYRVGLPTSRCSRAGSLRLKSFDGSKRTKSRAIRTTVGLLDLPPNPVFWRP